VYLQGSNDAFVHYIYYVIFYLLFTVNVAFLFKKSKVNLPSEKHSSSSLILWTDVLSSYNRWRG
jgi:hypothetical protein